MNTATLQSIIRVGQSDRVAVKAIFTDGSIKEYEFQLPVDGESALATIKADVDRLNSIDGQIQELQQFVGLVIS